MRPPRSSSVLVVGASGVLAPLVADLVDRGDHVVAVGRRAGALSALEGSSSHTGLGPTTVAADTTSVEGARRTLEVAGPLDHAVVYGPAVGAATLSILLRPVLARSVLVLTSGAVEPPTEPGPVPDPGTTAVQRRPRAGDGVVILGWKTASDGRRQWHDPVEISDAAMRALDGVDDVVLGRLSPWSERPR